ncbi:hypothetical protein F4777DRAFT_323599 [Nemania sp. FL0916]|nr:hypothetical protein F4777DRAFT_323599 [Nemania sp. FL0916]
MSTEELNDINYKGIGAGVVIPRYRKHSRSEYSLSLSDDWQLFPSQHETSSGPIARVNEQSSTSPMHKTQNEQYLRQNLTPLQAYYYHPETHEQLAVGQPHEHRSLTRQSNVHGSLEAVVGLSGDHTSPISESSWVVASSNSCGGPSGVSTPMPENHFHTLDPPEASSVPREEQVSHTTKVSKLKRRFEAEGNPRAMKPPRIRKRSKESNKSSEATEGQGFKSYSV